MKHIVSILFAVHLKHHLNNKIRESFVRCCSTLVFLCSHSTFVPQSTTSQSGRRSIHSRIGCARSTCTQPTPTSSRCSSPTKWTWHVFEWKLSIRFKFHQSIASPKSA